MMKYILRDFEYIRNPVIHIPITFIRQAVFGKTPYWKQYFWNKWGFLKEEIIKDLEDKNTFWINAISGGEVTQSVSFSTQLRNCYSGYKTILSTDSYDAFSYAEKIHMADYIIDAPWDIPWVVKRCLKKLRPRAIIYIENAFYPILLAEAKKLNIKNILISGRMNENVLKGHILFRRAKKMNFFDYLDHIGVKTEEDRDNFMKLGCAKKEIYVLGDLKYDLEYIRLTDGEREGIRKELGFLSRDKIFLAGSIHRPEFNLVVNAYIKVKKILDEVKMIFAPRWLHEIKTLLEVLKSKRLRYRLRSDLSTKHNFDILILDTFGELPKIYGISDVVYIGNSLIPINERGAGHNIIEPLAHGKPIIFGSYMNFWRDVTERLKAVYPPCEMKSGKEMSSLIYELITNKELAAKLASSARHIALEHSGAVEKYIEFIKDIIK